MRACCRTGKTCLSATRYWVIRQPVSRSSGYRTTLRLFWIRSFENERKMEASQNRFHKGHDWLAIKDRIPTLIEHSEVIMMNPVEFE